MKTDLERNIFIHKHSITREDREKIKGHKGIVLFMTGLSGSGKSTLANAVEAELNKRKIHTYILDGDNVRAGLNSNLGFTDDDRKENIRRISEVSKLFTDAGTVVLTAFISPFKEDRDRAREIIGSNFIEVYIDADLETCESRDPKGLYKKARAGQIPHFTGIDSPYEAPGNPELTIRTGLYDLESCTIEVVNYLLSKILP
jgi:adenylylsulfate kinase